MIPQIGAACESWYKLVEEGFAEISVATTPAKKNDLYEKVFDNVLKIMDTCEGGSVLYDKLLGQIQKDAALASVLLDFANKVAFYFFNKNEKRTKRDYLVIDLLFGKLMDATNSIASEKKRLETKLDIISWYDKFIGHQSENPYYNEMTNAELGFFRSAILVLTSVYEEQKFTEEYFCESVMPRIDPVSFGTLLVDTSDRINRSNNQYKGKDLLEDLNILAFAIEDIALQDKILERLKENCE